MARGHGRILTSIWEDADFLMLSQEQQRLYLFLISQPNLNHAGLLPLTLRRWARKAAGLTPSALEKTLFALDDAHFLVVDDDTEELLIRSFVRNDGVWKQPKVMGAMVSGAMEISSRKLRRALLEEMDRIPLDELNDEPGNRPMSIRQEVLSHIRALHMAFREPEPTPPRGASTTPSATPSESPSDTPAEEGPRGSTRVSAGARDACAPLPLPLSPAPTPGPSHVSPSASAVAPHEEVTAQTLVAEWLDHVEKRPPGTVIGQTSKHLKQLLAEGIDPHDIRRGLASWSRKGLHPSTLPSEVNAAMNAGSGNVVPLAPGQLLPGDARFSQHAALTHQLRALEGGNAS